jgi:hypothetical protein
MTDTLKVLKKLLESAVDLLDVDKDGDFIDFELLLCNCCRATIIEEKSYNNFIKQVKSAQTFMKAKKSVGTRLTVGYRAHIKQKSHWNEMFRNHDVLLEKRSGAEFAAIVLKKGFNGKLIKSVVLVIGGVAWIDEQDLELVDTNLADNLKFMDWYKEVEEDICPNCHQTVVAYGTACPKCKFKQY